MVTRVMRAEPEKLETPRLKLISGSCNQMASPPLIYVDRMGSSVFEGAMVGTVGVDRWGAIQHLKNHPSLVANKDQAREAMAEMVGVRAMVARAATVAKGGDLPFSHPNQ